MFPKFPTFTFSTFYFFYFSHNAKNHKKFIKKLKIFGEKKTCKFFFRKFDNNVHLSLVGGRNSAKTFFQLFSFFCIFGKPAKYRFVWCFQNIGNSGQKNFFFKRISQFSAQRRKIKFQIIRSQQSKILVKNRNFGQKSKFWSKTKFLTKIEILVKNGNIGQK